MKKLLFLLLIICGFLSACEDKTYTPKPKVYMRMEFPVKSYQTLDTSAYPFTFRYPAYAQIEPYTQKDEKYWFDVDFPTLGATINMTYKEIKHDSNLVGYINDCHRFINAQLTQASSVKTREYRDEENHIWARIFNIDGANVPSTCQFFITDSLHHFLRGSLYFNTAPNNDSLAPAINYIKIDIDSLVTSFRWKK